MSEEVNIIKEESKEIFIYGEKWTIHLKGIPRLTKEEPSDAFAQVFGFIKIQQN